MGVRNVHLSGKAGSWEPAPKAALMTPSGNCRPRDQIHFALLRRSIVIRFSQKY
jgi:hypothetical protein